jgi:hypothetical protein
MGVDDDRVRPAWPPRSEESSFNFEDERGDAVGDLATIQRGLERCAERLSTALTTRREYCRTVTLSVTLADNSWIKESEKLGLAVHTPAEIYAAGFRLLKRLPLAQPLLEIRLSISDLAIGSASQLTLLDLNDHGLGLPHERLRRLETTLSYLRKRFGLAAIVTAEMLRQAKRISLWAPALGHLYNEEVQVATDPKGRPMRYWRRGKRHEVNEIYDQWRETKWSWGSLTEKTVYRVETTPNGIAELHHMGVRWKLGAMVD